MASDKDFYELLGIKPTATENEIKMAWRRFSLEYHPDRNRDKSSNEIDRKEKVFKEGKDAFDTLGNYEKRNAYDRKLNQHANKNNQTYHQESQTSPSQQKNTNYHKPGAPSNTANGSPSPTPKASTSAHSKTTLAENVGAFLRFVIWHWKFVSFILLLILALNFFFSLKSKTAQLANNLPQCPTSGDPLFSDGSITYVPDLNSIGVNDYTISGKVSNPSDVTMSIDGMGVYIGNADPSKPPSLSTGITDVSNRTGVIPDLGFRLVMSAHLLGPRGSMTFTSIAKSTNKLNLGFPLVPSDLHKVTLTSRFPETTKDTPSPHWRFFIDADISCPLPN